MVYIGILFYMGDIYGTIYRRVTKGKIIEIVKTTNNCHATQ